MRCYTYKPDLSEWKLIRVRKLYGRNFEPYTFFSDDSDIIEYHDASPSSIVRWHNVFIYKPREENGRIF